MARLRSLSRYVSAGEQLEMRLALTSDTCLLDVTDLPQGDATLAAHSVNCFAFDLYRHYQAQPGNVVLSPFSISTALAMAYAGAAGQTAAEMEDVLHLGDGEGIHESYSALINAITRDDAASELQVANAQWPQIDFAFKQAFVDQIESQFGATSQALDYSDTETAKETINQWVEGKTNNRIQDLIKRLSPSTVMVLTNAIYFKAFWNTPFSPDETSVATFTLEDGTTKDVQMMNQPSFPIPLDEMGMDLPEQSLGYAYSEHGDFRVLEMPYKGDENSMVIMLPKDGSTTDDLNAQTLADVNGWLANGPERQNDIVLSLPKFKTTVSSALEDLLPDMGMPSAFGEANFSKMTDATIRIDQVGHKAFLELNEQGTEAAAATFVSFVICFAEGTPVLTPDGEKPIEQIQAGDYVLSRDEHDPDGPIEPMEVEETFQNRGSLLELHLHDRTLRATPEHPFYVQGSGWTKAGDLKRGDMLSADLDSWVELKEVVLIDGEHTVYNFRVAKHHTYFVGGKDFGFAVWTHNACGEPDPEFIVDRPFHFFIRDNATSATLFMGRISDPTLEAENKLELEFVPDDAQPLPGDANGDREVTFDDFLILSQNFGANDAAFADGDFDGDKAVTFVDFLILSKNFGKRA